MLEIDFTNVHFLLSVHKPGQLPQADLPEVAFAGRSNVGKSSCINTLVGRKNMVKVSSRPGKTQGLNFFLVGQVLRFVDLPGYGYAKVGKGMQIGWQTLITSYLETRPTLAGVVVILDARHPPKDSDAQLIAWLRQRRIAIIAVYTKIDKLSGNEREKNARILDAGHTIRPDDRVLFSAKTGQGRDDLTAALVAAIHEAQSRNRLQVPPVE